MQRPPWTPLGFDTDFLGKTHSSQSTPEASHWVWLAGGWLSCPACLRIGGWGLVFHMDLGVAQEQQQPRVDVSDSTHTRVQCSATGPADRPGGPGGSSAKSKLNTTAACQERGDKSTCFKVDCVIQPFITTTYVIYSAKWEKKKPKEHQEAPSNDILQL